ncbi:putative NAD-dependent histone deacetylase sirtuin-1 [Blattamonas nauphoetae]|uniref:NAD-dependent histone deacetylase sirtuin-1 n=1 Tax=Blattamonas nauphoetae TaxID=2049346 RepID=A0ABQ9X676_9EUKA|nr:putative NAD-dependent histone deacetylase sirtuin-1 [Blattamonas nauphoetae]
MCLISDNLTFFEPSRSSRKNIDYNPRNQYTKHDNSPHSTYSPSLPYDKKSKTKYSHPTPSNRKSLNDDTPYPKPVSYPRQEPHFQPRGTEDDEIWEKMWDGPIGECESNTTAPEVCHRLYGERDGLGRWMCNGSDLMCSWFSYEPDIEEEPSIQQSSEHPSHLPSKSSNHPANRFQFEPDTSRIQQTVCQRNEDCPDEMFCFSASLGSCGENKNQHMVCKERPSSCQFNFRPVCGCDGTTYDNTGFIQHVHRVQQALSESVRSPLRLYSTIDDAVSLIRKSSKIVVISGAGISVSCGIMDFRSPNGFYAMLRKEGIEPPEKIFTIHEFRKDPSLFYKYNHPLYEERYIPSLTHFFISRLEAENRLRRVYTQNIDNLESDAGVSRLLQVHGSSGHFSCMTCKKKVSIDAISPLLKKGEVLYCEHCPVGTGVMKPDIVFFGEDLPESFYTEYPLDLESCDLLIVTGTSMMVQPVSHLPEILKKTVPRILVNRDVVGQPGSYDIHLLGNIDTIFSALAERLSWRLPVTKDERTNAVTAGRDSVLRGEPSARAVEALMSDRGHKRTGNEYNKYSYTPQPSNERRQSQQTRTQKPRYESIPSDGTDGPQRSIEGYIIFISNLHEEVGEDQVKDFFLEFGNVTNIRMNLDHRTGAMKEYALVEYQTYQEALTAVEKGNGAEFLGKQLLVNFAFKQPPTRRLEPPQPVVETDVGEKQMIVDPQRDDPKEQVNYVTIHPDLSQQTLQGESNYGF